MMCVNRSLFIMAKMPEAGRTKTRLCPPLTPEAACELYARFLEDTVSACRQLTARVPGLTPGIAFAPAPDALAYFRGLAPDFVLHEQQGDGLSARLDGVLRAALAGGSDQVVAINSDSPTLPIAYLARAFDALDGAESDLVLGPSEDGGYYLIGVKQEFGDVVRSVRMSTPHVLDDTLAAASAEKLAVTLLPAWYDVDDQTMLLRLSEELATADTSLAPATRRMLATLRLHRTR